MDLHRDPPDPVEPAGPAGEKWELVPLDVDLEEVDPRKFVQRDRARGTDPALDDRRGDAVPAEIGLQRGHATRIGLDRDHASAEPGGEDGECSDVSAEVDHGVAGKKLEARGEVRAAAVDLA